MRKNYQLLTRKTRKTHKPTFAKIISWLVSGIIITSAIFSKYNIELELHSILENGKSTDVSVVLNPSQ